MLNIHSKTARFDLLETGILDAPEDEVYDVITKPKQSNTLFQ